MRLMSAEKLLVEGPLSYCGGDLSVLTQPGSTVWLMSMPASAAAVETSKNAASTTVKVVIFILLELKQQCHFQRLAVLNAGSPCHHLSIWRGTFECTVLQYHDRVVVLENPAWRVVVWRGGWPWLWYQGTPLMESAVPRSATRIARATVLMD